MDSTTNLRKKVQKYVCSADKKLLQMMEALAKSYQATESKTTITEVQKKELDQRLSRYEKGETQFYSWEEVEKKLDQAK